MKELFLGPLLVPDEVHIIDEQDIDPAIMFSELCGASTLDRRDHLVGELLGRNVGDFLLREALPDRMPDRMHEVRLPQPRASPDKERVVCGGGCAGDSLTGSGGKLVVTTDDEAVELVPFVQCGRGGWGRGGGLHRWRSRGSVRPDLGELQAIIRAVILEAKLKNTTELFLGELAEELAVLILDPLHGELRGGSHNQSVVRQ